MTCSDDSSFLILKTVKQEEPITRSRFIECPSCKGRTLKLKKIVQAGRCRNCRESYKIVIVFVKTGAKPKLHKTSPQKAETLPSWQMPSDTSLFGTTGETKGSTFSNVNFGWTPPNRENETGTSNGQ